MEKKSTEEIKIPNWVKFTIGGLSGMGATLFVQPMDLIKTRMQLANASAAAGATRQTSVQVLQSVIKNEGMAALYNG